MNVTSLDPQPHKRELFCISSKKFIPDVPGCYVCTDSYGTILYIGRSENIRIRFVQHLERKDMQKVVDFYWLESHEVNVTIERLERSWVELHEIMEGKIPEINKIYPSL